MAAAAVQVTHHQKSGDDATIQRLKLNEFLCASGKPPVKVVKKDWEHLSMRTKNDRNSKATAVVVVSFPRHCTKRSSFPLGSSEEL